MNAYNSDNLRGEVLIDADSLAALIQSGQPHVILVVWSADTDTSQPRSERQRIPGAIDTELGTDFAGPGGGLAGSRPLPSIADLQHNARRWGIGQDTVVVVYDHDRGLQAARAWWTLRWAGVAKVLLLDGGFQAWQRSGRPAAEHTAAPRPSQIVLSPGHMAEMDADEAAALARSGVLLDTRIAPNYQGGPAAPGEPLRGHIPGAVSFPASDNLTDDGAFLPAATLRERYRLAGARETTTVGIYCGAGVSAAHAVIALASIGIAAPMYVGSWSAWSADPTRPAVTGATPGQLLLKSGDAHE